MSAVWTIRDNKSANPYLDLAVVMLPPKTRSNAYDRALHVFDAVDVEPANVEDDSSLTTPQGARPCYQRRPPRERCSAARANVQ